MRWKKLGRVFYSDGQHPWMQSHASQPFARQVQNDLYRVYCTVRDRQNRSHIAWIEIDITRPDKILRVADVPFLAPGAEGAFDDAGAMMSCLVQHREESYLFYTGWSLRKSVPYHWSIGLSVGGSDGTFGAMRKLRSPVMDCNAVDPLLCASPYVIVENERWRMWYLSGLGWVETPRGVTPCYNMRYAESANGIEWERTGLVALDLERNELGFSRPSILRDDGGYQMWYAVRSRSKPYRLGFAHSPDGFDWTRDDEHVGLEPSGEGWDSEMIAYPHVFDHGTERYMLYCGNGFGESGFGLAVANN